MAQLRNAALHGDLGPLRAALAAPDAELEAIGKDGGTAFLLACGRGSAECIAALAEAGCDTAARGSNGRTGLMCAAGSGSAAAVEAVLAAGGAELEAIDKNGDTAFLVACAEGHAECIAALAEAGCDTLDTSSMDPLFVCFANPSVRPLIEAVQQKQRLREASKAQAQKRAELIESAKMLVNSNESMKDLNMAIEMVDGAEKD